MGSLAPRWAGAGAVTLLALGCGGGSTVPTDGGSTVPTDGGSDAATLVTVGADLDEQTPRVLATDCPLPPAFSAGLKSSSVATSELTMPDIGLTFQNDVNRFHWTDEVRHQGDLAPDLACMVAHDVEAAVALGDSDTTLRELLVAQGIYGHRDAYVVNRYDRAITVDASADPLVTALAQFYARPRYDGDTRPPFPAWADRKDAVAAQVAALSPTAQVAVAQAVLGLLAAADLRDQALTSGALGIADWPAQLETYFTGKKSNVVSDFGNAYKAANAMTAATDFDRLARAGQLAARSLESLRLALRDEPLKDGALLDLTGPLGRIVVSLQPSDDTWTGTDFFLLVDGGGNDTYQGDIAVNEDLYHPIAAVLDLAGDDQYVPSQPYEPLKDGPPDDRGPGTGLGAGWLGVALVDDAAGSDLYDASYYAAYGTWGVGAIVDHGGQDHYKGWVRSQGAADFGYGLLVDLGGSEDTYETLHNSQGFGGTRGLGWLVDDGGNDTYRAETELINFDPNNAPYNKEGSNFSGAQGFGWGLRVWDSNGAGVAYLSGGMGGLFDLGGNDTYVCAVMCQAWGYFFGTGLLYDKSGDDSYSVWHKYGIGGATHQAIGVFIDASGADHYEYTAGGIDTNGGSEGVGLGYDLGVGFHLDRGPEPDVYQFDQDKQKWGEVLGIARFPGIGVLINEGGDDEYHLPGVMGAYALGMTDMPYSDPPYREQVPGTASTISLGMFFDLGGADTYDAGGSQAKNDATWKQTAATTNSTQDQFDPALDHGYGFDGTASWPAWK
jgi:hypothetical protein